MKDDIETELPNLAGMNLKDLLDLKDQLVEDRTRLIAQVERPRPNIGTGPPGRAD